jgi:hypothetical protein
MCIPQLLSSGWRAGSKRLKKGEIKLRSLAIARHYDNWLKSSPVARNPWLSAIKPPFMHGEDHMRLVHTSVLVKLHPVTSGAETGRYGVHKQLDGMVPFFWRPGYLKRRLANPTRSRDLTPPDFFCLDYGRQRSTPGMSKSISTKGRLKKRRLFRGAITWVRKIITS